MCPDQRGTDLGGFVQKICWCAKMACKLLCCFFAQKASTLGYMYVYLAARNLKMPVVGRSFALRCGVSLHIHAQSFVACQPIQYQLHFRLVCRMALLNRPSARLVTRKTLPSTKCHSGLWQTDTEETRTPHVQQIDALQPFFSCCQPLLRTHIFFVGRQQTGPETCSCCEQYNLL